MIELNHLHLELAGMKLIDASAGTGKTYAIAGLYLRLLIEKGLAPEQILVVTYTEAATMELRRRIRERIRAALAVFDGGDTDDAFLSDIAANRNGKGPEQRVARDRLDRALNAFDTAAIYTIHAFCLHALQENAFESGSLYDTELVTNQMGLLQEVVDDFWRIRFFTDESPLLRQVLSSRLSPEKLVYFLNKFANNQNLEVRPSFGVEEIAAIEKRCRILSGQVRELWKKKRDEIVILVEKDKNLKRSEAHYRIDLLSALFAEMDSWAEGEEIFTLFPDFGKFTASGIAAGTKKTALPPPHPFFDLCEELSRAVGERFISLEWELVAFCRKRLPELKRKRNIRFFDDLLNDLHEALQGENGTVLSRCLREKYRAVLIDEFQDTDPVQYDIFKTVYAGSDAPLFLIGDPKQAIYSFRGADIFAYRKAKLDVREEGTFTLTKNWRSVPGLLDAFNTIFNGTEENRFVYEWIEYNPVTSGKKETKEGAPVFNRDAPFQIWMLPPGADGKPLTAAGAHRIIPGAVAGEIVRLLEEGHAKEMVIDKHRLFPGDIAVLVRDRWQAGSIQKALRECHVPSVVRSDMSVFASAEAGDLLTVLIALAGPGSGTRIRAALVTDIFGLTGDDIALLLEDEQAWDAWIERFLDWHKIWEKSGFMVMAQSLLASCNVRGRLLAFPDGERRLTNLLHCLELVHRHEHDERICIEGLVAWFADRINMQEENEEHQIRLETDEKAVRIATIHASKGLEYPIVFCPFMWEGIKDDEDVAAFHDGLKLVKDFGSPSWREAQTKARREILAESLRLLYVALTRAKYRCYLIAGKVVGRNGYRRPENSALAYLFHASGETRSAAAVADLLVEETSALTPEKIQEQLESLHKRGRGAIAIAQLPKDPALRYVPPADEQKQFAVRKFSGYISNDWHVASFTSFAAHENLAHERPDRDEEWDQEKQLPAAGEKTIFTFPRGAQAGIFFHEIFEELDFACATSEKVHALIGTKLEKYGYEKDWLHPLVAAIEEVLHTPLASPEGAFTLADLKPGRWISELEFFFPLKLITSELIGGCLKKWDRPREAVEIGRMVSALNFRPVRGMVRGFMDMVFEHAGKYYLLDWKSNHLGSKSEDYGPEALKAAMENNIYPLQYLLYTVALNRYLKRRIRRYDYESHFGGVIYVFVRGANAEKGEKYGFFRDFPPSGMIEELTGLLIMDDEMKKREGL